MKLKDLILIVIFTTFFSFLIFIAKNYFFWWRETLKNNIIEEKYIEPTAISDFPIINQENNTDNEIDNKIEEEPLNTIPIEKVEDSEKNNIKYTYVPRSFWLEKNALSYEKSLNEFLMSDFIYSRIDTVLDIILYQKKVDVRWKLMNKKLRLYWIYNLSINEFLAVWIHEYAHFLDLYLLNEKRGMDLSYDFYNISWETEKIIKSNQSQKDFVSGYSMTNKYEDFAETYTYYILHNVDFKEKTKKSSILKEKYDFFEKNIFLNSEFKNVSFRWENVIKDYYRDITKIEFSLENFLQYLKN